MSETSEMDLDGMDEEKIDRIETGYRIGLTILFWIIARIADAVIGLIVVFSLAIAFITQRPPSSRIRAFANRVVTYHYKLCRYLVYCDVDAPFPFRDFPSVLEPDGWRSDVRESENLDLGEI